MSTKKPESLPLVTYDSILKSSSVTNHLEQILVRMESIAGVSSTVRGSYNSVTRLAHIVADDEDYDFTEEDHKEMQEMIDKYNTKHNNKLVKVLK